MTVGSIQTTLIPQQSGIYEALLEKAERERDEARKEKEKWGLYAERVERERDYYKESIEEISTTIDDWLNSLVQEPPDDFIRAIKAWADRKLKEI
jgi:GTP1/Obg family GTP-binding protein